VRVATTSLTCPLKLSSIPEKILGSWKIERDLIKGGCEKEKGKS